MISAEGLVGEEWAEWYRLTDAVEVAAKHGTIPDDPWA